jgi:CdiI N-terminal domain
MTFSIQFVEQGSWELWFAPGELVLNDSIESFVASVDPGTEWTRHDYERQWRDGLTRIIDGEPKSCLITSLPDPGQTDFLVFWPTYRVRDWVVFQEKWKLPKGFPCGFDPAKPYQIVEDWISISDTGHKLSEWWVSYVDVIEFCRNGS